MIETSGGPVAGRSAERRARRRLGEDQRREQIVRATVSAVAAHGYHHTSLARIAAHAQVSKGLISHYFVDKDDLMARAVVETIRDIRNAVAAELDLTRPVPEVIRAAIRRAARLHITHRAQLAALTQIVHNLRGTDGTQRLSLADYEETYRAQQELFARGQAEGTLRPLDPRLMAVTYQGAIDTMLGYVDAHPDTDLQHYADTVADIFLGGVQIGGLPPTPADYLDPT